MENFNPAQNLKKTLKPLVKSEAQNQILGWLVTGLAFILPLFFLPFTFEFYVFNKTILLFLVVCLMLSAWLLKVFWEQKFSLLKTPLNWSVLTFMGVVLISCLFQAPNKLYALSRPGGLLLILGLFYFFLVNQLRGRKQAVKIVTALLVSSVILSWISIFSFLNVFEKTGLAWLASKAWSPAGSPLIAGTFIACLLPGVLFWAFKSKDGLDKTLLSIVAGLQVVSLVFIVLLFVQKTLTLSYLMPNFGWQISVEGFKSLRTALFGVGPGNFISAFSQFRPVGLNNTPYWTAKFGNNSNQYFHFLSTLGVLGLGAYVLFLLKGLAKENFKGSLTNKVMYIWLATSAVLQLVFPASILILFLTFLLAGLMQTNKLPASGLELGYETWFKEKKIVWATLGLGTVLALFTFYWQGRTWLADYYFMQSMKAASENRGGDTYNLQVKAIRLNPLVEGYRLAYAKTNFALANTLSLQKDLSDQDTQNIIQLISQAVSEAKQAISFNPQNSEYWYNLAQLYRNLINVAQDAQRWSIASYVEAIKRDPTNPLLRVDLGGLFFALRDYDQAIAQFNQAVNLKSDYANAYYNLAAAYKMKEDWPRAYQNMQLVRSLIQTDNPDYPRVLDELEELESKLPSIPAGASPSGEVKEEDKIEEPPVLPSPQPGMKDVDLGPESKPVIGEEEIDEATQAGEIE